MSHVSLSTENNQVEHCVASTSKLNSDYDIRIKEEVGDRNTHLVSMVYYVTKVSSGSSDRGGGGRGGAKTWNLCDLCGRIWGNLFVTYFYRTR